MKPVKYLLLLIFMPAVAGLFAQANSAAGAAASIAPGSQARLAELLNKPAMVSPAKAASLGKNWFKLETDAHVFSDEVSVRQVSAVYNDFVNQEKNFTGKKAILAATVVSSGKDGTVVDFVSTTIAPMGIKIRAPYRALVTEYENTDMKASIGIRQFDTDSASNTTVKGMYSVRYAESVTIGGKAYTYIRLYVINDVNGSILPNAGKILESQSGPAILESVDLIIRAAKSK